jgi:hypothetical protein
MAVPYGHCACAVGITLSEDDVFRPRFGSGPVDGTRRELAVLGGGARELVGRAGERRGRGGGGIIDAGGAGLPLRTGSDGIELAGPALCAELRAGNCEGPVSQSSSSLSLSLDSPFRENCGIADPLAAGVAFGVLSRDTRISEELGSSTLGVGAVLAVALSGFSSL